MEESEDLGDMEEARRLTEAFMIFTHHFQEYVKEMDRDLWKRAVDYAKTFTNVEGVEMTYADSTGCTAAEED